jgi:hypothetical protein
MAARRDDMKYLGIIGVVVVVLAALLLAASPRLFCQATLGTWVPAHQLHVPNTLGEDTYNPIAIFQAAKCQY